MASKTFSIRHQLLLLGALATASIWSGALLQYLQLREQSVELGQVRRDLATAERCAEAARVAGLERGLSNGWLSQAGRADPAELTDVRRRLDVQVAMLAADGASPQNAASQNTATQGSAAEVDAAVPPTGIGARLAELARLRGRIDRHDLPAAESFAFYSALVAALQDASASRLADSMIAVGLPYEHVNHVQRMAERIAQIRGLMTGALRAEALGAATEAALAQQLALLEEARRLYERSAPRAARMRLASALDAPSMRAGVDGARNVVARHRLDVLGLDATSWWALATEAVDGLQHASQRELAAVNGEADARIGAIERRLRWTVAALVVLGVVTLAMVLSTVGRIVVGLDRLLEGLDAVASRRNFNARIEEGRRDEFGRISGGINKLIAIAGSVVDEQETLSLTDALTGAVNRRGFDLQLDARTHTARAQATPLALVMIDIDHFKAVNDRLGHAAGDRVLKHLAQVLRGALRPDDVLARFGGEEFVVLLPGCRTEAAAGVAEKLRAAVQAHDFDIGRPVTASFGVAAWQRGQAPQALLAEADARLYLAKAEGRNRVVAEVRREVVAGR